MDWITCEDCETEYKIVSESLDLPAYCPFCGCESPEEDEDADEEFDDEWE